MGATAARVLTQSLRVCVQGVMSVSGRTSDAELRFFHRFGDISLYMLLA